MTMVWELMNNRAYKYKWLIVLYTSNLVKDVLKAMVITLITAEDEDNDENDNKNDDDDDNIMTIKKEVMT